MYTISHYNIKLHKIFLAEWISSFYLINKHVTTTQTTLTENTIVAQYLFLLYHDLYLERHLYDSLLYIEIVMSHYVALQGRAPFHINEISG